MITLGHARAVKGWALNGWESENVQGVVCGWVVRSCVEQENVEGVVSVCGVGGVVLRTWCHDV